jgi:hypothetical protein
VEAPASVAEQRTAVARRTAVEGMVAGTVNRKFPTGDPGEMRRSHMRRTKLNFDGFHGASFSKWIAAAVLLAGCWPQPSKAQQPGQKTFSSAQEACSALVTASESNDEKALLDILGPEAKQMVSSGDPAEDAQSRANFVKRYQQMHRLVTEPDGTTTLYVGAENWPMPIPLVSTAGSWYFDTDVAKTEILYRRIGRNEISTIHVCLQLVAAEKEYHSMHGNEYAQKIVSDQGQQNGLYWKSGESQSPIGPLVASAGAEAPGRGDNAPMPYRGYYYRILVRQGAAAPGGGKSYVVNGKMTDGFGFVAYPAEYRSSGVMTFIVDQDGTVYRRDLGTNTAAIAKAMKEYNPDSRWTKEQDQPEQTAAEQKTN